MTYYSVNLSEGITESFFQELETIAGPQLQLRKRLTGVTIELFQNIRKHAANNDNSKLLIRRESSACSIVAFNTIKTSDAEYLRNKIKHMNTLDRMELKREHSKILSNKVLTKKTGAGLGLYRIAIQSASGLIPVFRQINKNHIIFSLHITLTGRS